MGGEIGDGKRFKGGGADDGLEGGAVFSECSEDAEPVLAVVDFEALEGGETAVGGDEGGGDRGHGASVGGGGAHLLAGSEREQDGGGHFALEGFKVDQLPV